MSLSLWWQTTNIVSWRIKITSATYQPCLMMRYLPSNDRSTTVEPRRVWPVIGPPSTTTASLGQSSWNSFRRNPKIGRFWPTCKYHIWHISNGFTYSALTCMATVLVCELMFALVSARGSPHIWHRRLMKLWSGIRTPTSWGGHGIVTKFCLTICPFSDKDRTHTEVKGLRSVLSISDRWNTSVTAPGSRSSNNDFCTGTLQ